MDSMTHFYSKNVYFYLHSTNSLKVTALNVSKKFGLHPLKMIQGAQKWH